MVKSKGFSLIETVIFIVLAAIVIPVFYLTTQPVIKDMMTPTTYVKARFAAEKKMEELMAYRFTDTTLNVVNSLPLPITGDAAFPAADYAGYGWQYAITYLDCNNPSPVDPAHRCVGYTDGNPVLSPVTMAYTTNFKQIDITVTGPGGVSYRVSSMVAARY